MSDKVVCFHIPPKSLWNNSRIAQSIRQCVPDCCTHDGKSTSWSSPSVPSPQPARDL